MNQLLLLGAGFSFLYFIVIAVYTGMGSSFGYIWLAAAFVLLLLFFLRRWPGLFPFRSRLPLWLRVSAKTTVLLAFGLFAFIEALILRDMFLTYPEDLDYVVVLGARVDGERVTKSLQMRLDRALEYAETNPDVVMVVSGGQGAGEAISEAEAMERYLTERGFPESQVIQESHSRNTMENLKNSFSYIVVDWYGREAWEEGVNPRVGLITNNFHIFRARAIAKKQGFSTISGVPAGSDAILLPSLMCREFFALVKDWLVGNL